MNICCIKLVVRGWRLSGWSLISATSDQPLRRQPPTANLQLNETSHRNHQLLRIGVALRDAAFAADRRARRRIVLAECADNCSARPDDEARSARSARNARNA